MNKVVWLTGLSGAGKSTITDRLVEELGGIAIDGDVLRSLHKNQDFSRNGRFANIQKAVEICHENQDKLVIASLISPLRAMRDYARNELKDRYIEVYVQCSLRECINRDVKGLYLKALSGEIKDFTGIQQTYEEPISPDIVVNTEFFGIDECVRIILNRIER